MKKMNAPVMETVRFTEDDVIVASGAGNDSRSILMSGFGNSTLNDGSIRYNGVTYSGNSLENVTDSLYDRLGEPDPTLFNDKTQKSYALVEFIFSDWGDFAPTDSVVSSDMNGSYYWDGYRFVKR